MTNPEQTLGNLLSRSHSARWRLVAVTILFAHSEAAIAFTVASSVHHDSVSSLSTQSEQRSYPSYL